jgi:alpha-beta hydrolase superfamily lysophospholipase
VGLEFAGAVLDVGVTDLRRAEAFYAILIGRDPDLRPQPDQREWHLHRDPEVGFRVTTDPAAAGRGRVSIGVADLAAERHRLLAEWPGLPEASVKPGVITMLRLPDPDGNEVTLWQDLLRPGAGR